MSRIEGLFSSWRIYFRHEVRNAGIALAFFYLTVLGFDSITTGYAYSQGLSESMLGILLAVGAVIGILSTVVYPSLVRCLGVEKAGEFCL